MGKIRGHPVLVHPRPSPPTCFGSNEGFESSFVTATTGGRAWPMVPWWLGPNFLLNSFLPRVFPPGFSTRQALLPSFYLPDFLFLLDFFLLHACADSPKTFFIKDFILLSWNLPKTYSSWASILLGFFTPGNSFSWDIFLSDTILLGKKFTQAPSLPVFYPPRLKHPQDLIFPGIYFPRILFSWDIFLLQ